MLISFILDKDGFRISKPLDASFVTNVTYIKAHFDINEPTWDDAEVLVAVFKSATYNETCRVLLDENNNCFIEPKVFMRGGTIQVKLCGDSYDSDWVDCTTHLTDTIDFYIRPEALLPVEPPSKYAVFLAELERLKQEFDTTCASIKGSPFYDVTRYGILPDSGEDLYDVLFDFLHDVVAPTGGVVYFPQGTYEISDTIFIPPNTVFMGSGPATRIYFNEEYNSFGVGLSNGGSNVGVVNMTVDHNNSEKIVTGALTGAVGFSTRTFESWTTKHTSPSAHASCENVYAEDLWTNTRYILQSETHNNSDIGTMTGVTYRNIHAKNALVSVMGRNNNYINDVTVENVECAFLRMGVLASAESNYNFSVRNVRTGRLWLVGDMMVASDVLLLPSLKYDEVDSASTASTVFGGDGTIIMRDSYIDASQYVAGFARKSAKLKMYNTIVTGSTTRVAIEVDSVNRDETEIIGCNFTTLGTTGSEFFGRMENTYCPTMRYSSKVQAPNIGRERLPASPDLDDYKRAGGRYQCMPGNTASVLNKPSGLSGAFLLDIESQIPTDDTSDVVPWFIQKITPISCDAIYMRCWNGSSWTLWHEFTGTALS